MKKNVQGFSIIIGIGLVIIMSLVAYLILSYMHSFTQIVSGVQYSAVAYYNAYIWVEESLYHIKWRKDALTKEHSDLSPQPDIPIDIPENMTLPLFSTQSSSDIIPREWFGQSDFDNDWNTISQLHPLQIEIWGKSQCKGISSSPCVDLNNFIDSFKITFRAPKLEEWSNFEASTPCNNGSWDCWSIENHLPLLMWTLVSDDDSLTSRKISASDTSYIYADKINSSGSTTHSWKPAGEYWTKLSTDADEKFSDFFNVHCSKKDQKCSLRIGVVNELYDNNVGKKVPLPYLEYKIEMGAGKILPDQYTHIRSVWNAWEFRRQIDLFIPQQIVPQAFDFTVIQ